MLEDGPVRTELPPLNGGARRRTSGRQENILHRPDRPVAESRAHYRCPIDGNLVARPKLRREVEVEQASPEPTGRCEIPLIRGRDGGTFCQYFGADVPGNCVDLCRRGDVRCSLEDGAERALFLRQEIHRGKRAVERRDGECNNCVHSVVVLIESSKKSGSACVEVGFVEDVDFRKNKKGTSDLANGYFHNNPVFVESDLRVVRAELVGWVNISNCDPIEIPAAHWVARLRNANEQRWAW
jgi:hypothetical protein